MYNNLKYKILEFVHGDGTTHFDELALEIFNYQARNNAVFSRFLSLSQRPLQISDLSEASFMPIEFFKSMDIKTGNWDSRTEFLSSGTADTQLRSKHIIRDIEFYRNLSLTIFKTFYNEDYEVLALLPSYIENGESSLVAMVYNLIQTMNSNVDAYYMYDFDALDSRIRTILRQSNKKILLIGVSFALLDFAERYTISDSRLQLMFTGGMKNRRKEMHFEEVYYRLKKAFPQSSIDSEYGMTEMMSQSYVKDDPEGWFIPAASLQFRVMQIQDPFQKTNLNKTGQLAFIDLGNYNTASFVLTQDLAVARADGAIRIMGRMKDSDMRGCNLLYQN